MHCIRLLAVLLVLLGATACGTIDELQGMAEKQQALASELSELLGSKAEVGWNWNNGRLVDVAIHLEADALERKTVGELRDQILPVVARTFGETPQQVRVHLAWQPRGS
ncbi:MAG: hypothetical protein ACQGVC_05895 [Myxococcota bacterium]